MADLMNHMEESQNKYAACKRPNKSTFYMMPFI